MKRNSQDACVACIDVGSNSIKVLVARLNPLTKRVEAVREKTLETRISAGISRCPPRLHPESIARGVDSVRELYQFAQELGPAALRITATSAVRDATNGNDFLDAVEAVTGCHPEILSGDEEAALIGLGLKQDPLLPANIDGLMMDLGGGSMEILKLQPASDFEQQRVSLPLGAVRLMECFHPNPAHHLDDVSRTAIETHVLGTLRNSGIQPNLGQTTLIGTGGAVSCTRLLLATETIGAVPPDLGSTSPILTKVAVDNLSRRLCAMSLENRLNLPAMPRSRADIMPSALVTLSATMQWCGTSEIRHSFYNLRYGVAAQLLETLH